MTTLTLDDFDLIDSEISMTEAMGKQVRVAGRRLAQAKAIAEMTPRVVAASRACLSYRWTLGKAHKQVVQLNHRLGQLQRRLTGKERESLMAAAQGLAPLVSTVGMLVEALDRKGETLPAPTRKAYYWLLVDPLVAYHEELEDSAETMALASSATLAASLKSEVLPLICAR